MFFFFLYYVSLCMQCDYMTVPIPTGMSLAKLNRCKRMLHFQNDLRKVWFLRILYVAVAVAVAAAAAAAVFIVIVVFLVGKNRHSNLWSLKIGRFVPRPFPHSHISPTIRLPNNPLFLVDLGLSKDYVRMVSEMNVGPENEEVCHSLSVKVAAG